MSANLTRSDMKVYALYEQYLLERAASLEVKADVEPGTPIDPLQEIEIIFNGLRPMTLPQFINNYARKDEEAALLLQKLLHLFQEDMQAGLIPGAKSKEDFPKWLIARFGDDNPAADVLIFNPGEENQRFDTDKEESKHLEARWASLGFGVDLDAIARDFNID